MTKPVMENKLEELLKQGWNRLTPTLSNKENERKYGGMKCLVFSKGYERLVYNPLSEKIVMQYRITTGEEQ